jgi:sarcosine oxidase subunit beta
LTVPTGAKHELPSTADVVVIGAGVVGCSIAYHLVSRDRNVRVVVLERDAMPGMGATAKATGGIRHQFSSEPNIRLTQISLPIYRRFQELSGYSVNFRAHGYLFVTTDAATHAMFRENVALQQSLGVPSRLVDPDEIARMVPGMRTDDLVAGTFCPDDGSAEPAAAVQGFAAAARRGGAQILMNCAVTEIRTSGNRVTGVRTATGGVDAPVVVVAAGAYTSDVARLAGVDIPAKPYRRQVSVSEPVAELDVEIPLATDADTGFYVHRSGGADLMLGGTDRDVRPGYGLDVDTQVLDRMLAAAVRRIPVLTSARIRRSYVGLRGLTPDFNMILGRVRGVDGLVLACGDNGHGFMHAPATGLLLSEEIIDGRAATLDIAPFRLERFTAAQSEAGGHSAADANARPAGRERSMH